MTEIPSPKLISSLRGYNLLPAIIFMPTRRRCDESALEVAFDKSQKQNLDKREKREEIFRDYIEANPEIRNHKHRKILLHAGIAAHHAGHMPAWKLLIEKMMSKGLLEAIFATSTVAAGVDFPARSVVISFADTRSNDGWRTLKASELQQMTGRAGRRGKDHVGFVILAPSQFQNPKKIAELLKSPPDALQSQFRATYTSLLNLLDAYKSLSQVREIAEKSFAFRHTAKTVASLEKEAITRKAQILQRIVGSKLTIDDVRGFERLTNIKTRLQDSTQENRADVRHGWLKHNAIVGRIVSQGRSGRRFFIILQVVGDTIVAMRDDGESKNFDIHRINAIYENVYQLRDNAIARAFDEMFDEKNPQIRETVGKVKTDNNNEAVELVNDAIERLIPPKLSEDKIKLTYQVLWENWSDAEFLYKTDRDLDTLRNEIWIPFEQRTSVLNHFGYLDLTTETVTESGKWLADLRVDRPLLVGETLKSGLFENLQVKQAVALMASLASDPDRSFGELRLSESSNEVLTGFEEIAYNVDKIEIKNGVPPAPEINYSAAATAEYWANENVTWSELVTKTRAEEGDLIRLLSRTGEALNQIAHLKKSQPEAADVAKRAADIVLREPIR